MLKNPTPQQIAFFASLAIAIFSTTGFLLLSPVLSSLHFILLGLIWTVLVFGISYFILIYYLRKYIYRKIKLIYKTIHKHKISASKKNTPLDLSNNIIEEVEKEVEDWADTQKKELDKYKSWAEYRRKFVGDISHELKTPIFNIQGYIHTLMDGGLHDDNVNVSFLKKAAKNIHRLHTIVEDLEAISRLESGELILDMQSFDIKELAEEVFEDLEIKAADRNIRLEFKDGASSNYKVIADRESIRQVLMNLVHNSVKYGKDGGLTKLGFYDMDKNILIEVADNGIGIPKKHLHHVFDRFYRVDKSRSRAQGGSGLGLSIVKHIIEGHKQTINVRSTVKLGSTFGFTLEKA
jgi:two-component system phosphate regulon sensor histidine kinase PhoR